MRLNLRAWSSSLILLSFACGGSAPAPGSLTAKAPEPSPAEAKSAPDKPSDTGTPSSSTVGVSKSAPDKPSAPAAEPPITSVRVYVTNECDKPVAYCVEDGSTLNTSLTQRTSTTHSVKPGARILEKPGSSCGSAKFTVPASKDEVKFSICKK